MKNNYYKNRIFIVFLVILVTLCSGYALSLVYDFKLIYLKIILSIILIIPMFKSMNYNFKNRYFFLFLFIYGIILSLVGAGFNNLNGYLGYIVNILLSFEIALIYDFVLIKKIFLKCMTYISIISIIGYIIVNVFGIALPIVSNVNSAYYHNGIIFFSLQGNEIRNTALFWEPGLFASFLALAILLVILDSNKLDIKLLVLFYLTLITTTSSAGYLLMVLTVFLILSKNKKKSIFSGRTFFNLFLLFILIIIAMNIDFILTSYFIDNKFLMKLTSTNIINSTRFQAFKTNVSLFWASPLVGQGLKEYALLTANEICADTSTSLSMMAIFGAVGIIYSILIIWPIISNRSFDFYSKIIICLILLIIVNKEPHHDILFSWIIIWSHFIDFNAKNSNRNCAYSISKEFNKLVD